MARNQQFSVCEENVRVVLKPVPQLQSVNCDIPMAASEGALDNGIPSVSVPNRMNDLSHGIVDKGMPPQLILIRYYACQRTDAFSVQELYPAVMDTGRV